MVDLWTVLLSVDFSGKFLYVTNYGSNNVSAFTIDPASGALSPGACPDRPKPSIDKHHWDDSVILLLHVKG